MSTYTEERKQVIKLLHSLGLSPLPVAPRQDPFKYPKKDSKGNIQFQKDGITPVPLFTGKNPSYLETNGIPRLVNHTKYQKIQPTEADLQLWFANPLTGIGTLGNDSVVWIDIDSNKFATQKECDQAYEELLANNPSLNAAWLERTQSGGYRLGINLTTKKDFTNFKLSANGGHVGEALGEGRFTVLAPTVGASGQSYQNINRPRVLPNIQSLESIGVFAVKDTTNQGSLNFGNTGVADIFKGRQTSNLKIQEVEAITLEKNQNTELNTEPNKPEKSVFLIDCVTPQTKMILEGITDLKDKSDALNKAFKDLYGWVNWLNSNNIGYYAKTPIDIAYAAGQAFNLDNDRVDRIIKSINIESCQPAAKYKGGDEACWKKVNKLLKNKSKLEKSQTLSEEEIAFNKQSAKELADKLRLKLNFHPESGELIGDLVPKAITVAKKIGDILKFNEMSQEFELEGRSLDLDFCNIIIESECGITVGKDKAIDLIICVGKTLGSYHPVREYLKNLVIPDNTDILNNLASRYLGNSDPLANVYLKKTLIGAVQRVINPGSKMDTMCILYGGQGIGKSTFWSELVNVVPEKILFTDGLQDLANKDELAKLRSNWCLELAEIDYLFSTKAKEQFKRFLSARDDTYRPSYARKNIRVDRTCFFAGTTNKKELLSDESGARRFWIIECLTEKIPIALLKEERDLIWAAAYKAVLDGEICYLSDNEQKLSNEANKAFQDVDPWLGVIQSYLADNQYQSIATAGIYKVSIPNRE